MNQLKNKIFCGGNLEVVSSWPSNFISAIVCDPPYGLEFMGKEWDKLTRNLMNPTSEADKNRKIKYNKNYAGRRSNLPDYKTIDQNAMQNWHYQWAKAMLRITKPGGFLLCFGGTRTYHRLTCAIEDAGWEIRDCMMWLYGSGFPKSLNISLVFEKRLCETREIDGQKKWFYKNTNEEMRKEPPFKYPLANEYFGIGTALKPAWSQSSWP